MARTQAYSGGNLDQQLVASLHRSFVSEPRNKIVQNAVTLTSADQIVLNHEVAKAVDHSYSHHIDDWAVTNQKASGRCWIFAGLNLLRAGAMKKMNIANFEFSQNHTLFWDKFEKCNFFLEKMIELADRDIDDRTVSCLLGSPISDGGQWNMFVNIIKKYGVLPKPVMPETESSSNTGVLNHILFTKLRLCAKELREAIAAGAPAREIRAKKAKQLNDVYRIMAIHLGTPPEKFDFQWRDKKKKFHRIHNMTPQSFAKQYVTIPLDDYICLVHDPRNKTGRTYTVNCLGNVVGGDEVKYLNVDIDVIRKVAMKTLVKGEPVWFGCDCGKSMNRSLGVWCDHLYDYESLYNTELTIDKEMGLLYRHTAMNHAMLFTGVDVVKGKPRRWRVENSWGDTIAQKGFFMMTDGWFTDNMFEIAARKSMLSAELQRAYKKAPVVLPAWDPMGSLA